MPASMFALSETNSQIYMPEQATGERQLQERKGSFDRRTGTRSRINVETMNVAYSPDESGSLVAIIYKRTAKYGGPTFGISQMGKQVLLLVTDICVSVNMLNV